MTKEVDEIASKLDAAQRAVDAAGLSDDLRKEAFKRALDLLLGQAAPRRAPPSGVTGSPAQVSGGGSDVIGRIAEKASLDPELMKQVFDYDDDRLSVVIGDSRIDDSSAGGTRELTLLVAGGRQAAGLEEWTSLAHAREACTRYGRLDSSNFAATVVAMDDEFSFKGSGQSRQIRLTMRGWERWSELVARLVGQGDE